MSFFKLEMCRHLSSPCPITWAWAELRHILEVLHVYVASASSMSSIAAVMCGSRERCVLGRYNQQQKNL